MLSQNLQTVTPSIVIVHYLELWKFYAAKKFNFIFTSYLEQNLGEYKNCFKEDITKPSNVEILVEQIVQPLSNFITMQYTKFEEWSVCILWRTNIPPVLVKDKK